MNESDYYLCKRQCKVIRAAAPGQMIVSGNNAWLSPDQDWMWDELHAAILAGQVPDLCFI